jgi:hypothetical protein
MLLLSTNNNKQDLANNLLESTQESSHLIARNNNSETTFFIVQESLQIETNGYKIGLVLCCMNAYLEPLVSAHPETQFRLAD